MPSTTPTSEEVAQMRAKELGVTLLPLSEAQKELNNKLFKGWSMLDQVCPISNYPLVKDPKSGMVWSIRCQMEVGPDPAKRVGKDLPQSAECAGSDGFADADTQSLRIAAKVVDGWELTGEICPVSHKCPVLLDPRSGKRWSPAMGKYLTDSGEPEDGSPCDVTISKAGPPAGSARVDTSSNQLEPGEPKPTQTPAAAAARAADPARKPTNSAETVSRLIGEKLLMGWTMLEEECPLTQACPLMRDPKSGRRWTAALGDFLDNLSAQQAPATAAPAAVSPQLPPERAHEAEPASPERSARPALAARPTEADLEAQSARIGDLLVRGWTMLDQVCPVTRSCPLLMDPKTKKNYSAALNRFVTDADYEEQDSPSGSATCPPPSVPSAGAPGPATAAKQDMSEFMIGSWKEAAEEAFAEDLDGLDGGPVRASTGPLGGRAQRAPAREAAKRASDHGRLDDIQENASTRSVLSGVSHNGDTGAELERAEATLRSKMRECRQALANMEISLATETVMLDRCAKLAEMIGVCATSIARLQGVPPR